MCSQMQKKIIMAALYGILIVHLSWKIKNITEVKEDII